MAKMEHYKNGKWVGSTETKGHSNTTGWVNTYSADGKVRSTWVSNTDQFDYKEGQHPPKSIEEIRDSRAASNAVNELFDKLYRPFVRILLFIFIGAAIVGTIWLIGHFVLKALPNDIIEKLQSMSTYIGIGLGGLLNLAGVVFAIYVFMPSNSKKKSNKKKK